MGNEKRQPLEGKRTDEPGRLDLQDEVHYIQERAAEADTRVVKIGKLLLFSAENGDAWILDTTEQLACMIAHEGAALPVSLERKDQRYAVKWTGRYRIDGASFIYVGESSGDFEAYRGYPLQQIKAHTKENAPPLLSADREALDLLQQLKRQVGRE